MSEIEAMIKTLHFAGYEVLTRRQLMELQAENAALRAALEAVEWLQVGARRSCPWCGGIMKHKPDCQRQKALGIVTE